MTTPELPPLRRYDLCLRGYENTMKRADDGDYCDNDDREARERILLARIAELEADAARYRWLRDQVRFELPNQRDSWTTPSGVYLVATMVSAVYGDCGEQVDAAIDAAREAKP